MTSKFWIHQHSISFGLIFPPHRIDNFEEIPREEDLFKYMSEPDNRTGMIVQRDWMLNFFRAELHSGLPSISILDEKFETMYVHLIFTRNLPYSCKFLQKINEMISTGIIQKFRYEIFDDHQPNKKEEKIEPQVLTMDHLRIGFFSFLIACSLSATIFLVEVFIGFVKKVFQEV